MKRAAVVFLAIFVAFGATTAAASYTDHEIDMLAKAVWGEARGTTPEEQRLVVWTVLQRVYTGKYGDTIEAVLTAPRQFQGYSASNPVCPEIRALVEAEVKKWERGEDPPTMEPYAKALPYLYFDGDGRTNWFRGEWKR